MTNILIATPAYRGIVDAQYAAGLVGLVRWLTENGIKNRYVVTEGSVIAAQRNNIATGFYSKPEFTHLLFVDSDVSPTPTAVKRLIEMNTPLCGYIYPTRGTGEATFAILGKPEPVSSGVCKAAGIGMGLCLIRRDALERLVATGKIEQRQYFNASQHPNAVTAPLGFFTELPGMSEDLSFCERWRTLCGGEIFALYDEQIGHSAKIVIRSQFAIS